MSEVSLHLTGNTEWLAITDPPTRFFAGFGMRAARWWLGIAERNLDKNLAMLTGYFELSLLFSQQHAGTELIASKRSLEQLLKIHRKQLKWFHRVEITEEFEASFVQKLELTIQLIEAIKHRLYLVSLLDLEKMTALDPEIKREVLALNELRHQTLLKNHPEDDEVSEMEAREWLSADLHSIIEE